MTSRAPVRSPSLWFGVWSSWASFWRWCFALQHHGCTVAVTPMPLERSKSTERACVPLLLHMRCEYIRVCMWDAFNASDIQVARGMVAVPNYQDNLYQRLWCVYVSWQVRGSRFLRAVFERGFPVGESPFLESLWRVEQLLSNELVGHFLLLALV